MRKIFTNQLKSNESMNSYLIVFFFSIILNGAPFFIVIYGMSNFYYIITLIIVVGTGILQIIIQLFFFMNIHNLFKDSWNLVALIFTFFIIGIIILGSFWIMYHINRNMLVI